MTLLLDTSLWIDFTRARRPAPVHRHKQLIQGANLIGSCSE
jgi:hypothetical protein